MVTQMGLGAAKRAATGSFTFAQDAGNLGKVVLKDFTQQKDCPLKGLQLL
jgi:hypothetical protein